MIVYDCFGQMIRAKMCTLSGRPRATETPFPHPMARKLPLTQGPGMTLQRIC